MPQVHTFINSKAQDEPRAAGSACGAAWLAGWLPRAGTSFRTKEVTEMCLLCEGWAEPGPPADTCSQQRLPDKMGRRSGGLVGGG